MEDKLLESFKLSDEELAKVAGGLEGEETMWTQIYCKNCGWVRFEAVWSLQMMKDLLEYESSSSFWTCKDCGATGGTSFDIREKK
jgi:predicted nucleic-acid-binding Zn-ribbon protein